MTSSDLLLAALPHAEARAWRSFDVPHIVHDSRRVAPGDLFVAVPGVAWTATAMCPTRCARAPSPLSWSGGCPSWRACPRPIVPNAREALA